MHPYLLFLLLFFALPLIPLAWLCRRALVRYRRTLAWSLAFVCAIGGPWDWLSSTTGVWRYDSGRTVGLWFQGLPVEEFAGFYLLGTLLIVSVTLSLLRGRDHV
jgi:lycopene cyclase domain-containing protein